MLDQSEARWRCRRPPRPRASTSGSAEHAQRAGHSTPPARLAPRWVPLLSPQTVGRTLPFAFAFLGLGRGTDSGRQTLGSGRTDTAHFMARAELQWPCRRCTYINAEVMPICEVCGETKPPPVVTKAIGKKSKPTPNQPLKPTPNQSHKHNDIDWASYIKRFSPWRLGLCAGCCNERMVDGCCDSVHYCEVCAPLPVSTDAQTHSLAPLLVRAAMLVGLSVPRRGEQE